eukprot:COSAG01_NODE_170_length_23136_cov_24.853931_5_plen_49_part_00
MECGECQKFSPQGGEPSRCSVTPIAELARDDFAVTTGKVIAATVDNCK